nr:hypothetical protein [Actinopolyspora mortivallis]
MNTESVAGWLEAMGVPARVVSLGAEADDAWCLLRGESEGQPVWDVFWREQGNRYDWARFTSEQVACFYLFGRLTWTQALRGVVGPLDTGSTPPRGIPVSEGAAEATGDVPAVGNTAGSPPTGTPAPGGEAGGPPASGAEREKAGG